VPATDKASWAAVQEAGWRPEQDMISKSFGLRAGAAARLSQQQAPKATAAAAPAGDAAVLSAIRTADGEAKDVGQRLLAITQRLQARHHA
jgi:hypothetical protein